MCRTNNSKTCCGQPLAKFKTDNPPPFRFASGCSRAMYQHIVRYSLQPGKVRTKDWRHLERALHLVDDNGDSHGKDFEQQIYHRVVRSVQAKVLEMKSLNAIRLVEDQHVSRYVYADWTRAWLRDDWDASPSNRTEASARELLLMGEKKGVRPEPGGDEDNGNDGNDNREHSKNKDHRGRGNNDDDNNDHNDRSDREDREDRDDRDGRDDRDNRDNSDGRHGHGLRRSELEQLAVAEAESRVEFELEQLAAAEAESRIEFELVELEERAEAESRIETCWDELRQTREVIIIMTCRILVAKYGSDRKSPRTQASILGMLDLFDEAIEAFRVVERQLEAAYHARYPGRDLDDWAYPFKNRLERHCQMAVSSARPIV